MADKLTDASNKEQVAVVIHWVYEGLNVREDFVRLHQVDTVPLMQKPLQERSLPHYAI